MSIPIQVTFDCADADRMAAFWAVALDYQLQPPPPGYESWEDWLDAMGIPQDPGRVSAIIDPEGRGPRLLFQRVPEPKQAKNRVHLDVNAGGGREVGDDERRARIAAKVTQLEAAGASHVGEMEENGERWTVMTDPEGNEFCLQ